MVVAALNRTNEKTQVWLKELAHELDWDEPDMVFQALRGVLQTLRDRLPLDESAQLAGQLPMLIRGCYYENWSPKKDTEHWNAEAFAARVALTFPGNLTVDPYAITRAVFRVVDKHVSPGEVKDVKACLPETLREMWP
tara:strand:+ start:105428 stop:105841 length:414 start_codon:yes stop_codon:yes gene_type:complete